MDALTSKAGLTFINTDTSKAFLSLRGGGSNEGVSEATECYSRLLEAFDGLCNLNLRDREYANRIIAGLENSCLNEAYPEILTAVRSWGAGDIDRARSHFLEHLAPYPTDFVALFMLHMFDFLHGRSDLYSQYLFADERCEDPDFGGYYKGMLAFSLCEQGDPATGYPLAFDACDREDLDDIYSVHALVHCWHAMGDHESVVDFLRTRKHQWLDNQGMNIHVNWHLAVSQIALGDFKESIEAYHQFRGLSVGPHAEQDLDAVNFCVRHFLKSLPRPEFFIEYQTLARNWAPSIFNSLSYFNDAHAAIAFMLAGDTALMKKLLSRPEISVMDRRTRETGQTILHAINDFMNEEYSRCVERFESTRADWYRIGGSHAQREIFDMLENAAKAMQCGDLALRLVS